MMKLGLMSLLLLCPLSWFIIGTEDTITVEPPIPNFPTALGPTFVDTFTFEGVIIPPAYLEEEFGYSLDITWTPTSEQILAMDAGVAVFLSDSEHPMLGGFEVPVWDRLDEYKRHYYGLTIDDDNVIHAEYYCDTFDDDWWKQPLIVADGGACFFRFDYNPATDTYFNLSVNGMA